MYLVTISNHGGLVFQDVDPEGQLVLRCVADARPPNVTYYWYHNEEPLTAVTDATLHFRSNSYTFCF